MPSGNLHEASPPRLRTRRLELIAADAESARADAAREHERLAALLAADVPAEWPPELTIDAMGIWAAQLAAQPEQTGWWSWFFVHDEGVSAKRVLTGGGGFMGPPTAEGAVEVGYSVLEPFQQRGFATEGMRALVDWAFEDPRVTVVTAQTFPNLAPSLGVIEKLGMRYLGVGAEAGAIRFGLTRGENGRLRPAGDAR